MNSLNMKSINISMCRNVDNTLNSIYITDNNNKMCGFIGRSAYPNDEYGWFTMLHKLIVNTKFTYPKVILSEASDIVDKWTSIHSTPEYNSKSYLSELFDRVVKDIGETEYISDEIDDIIGECSMIEYVDLSRLKPDYQVIFNFDNWAFRNGLNGLTFYVHNRIGQIDHYSMVVYDTKSHDIMITDDPISFFGSMSNGLYGFGGMINISGSCGFEIDEKMNDIVKSLINKRIESLQPKEFTI